jgi:hypothetical protein
VHLSHWCGTGAAVVCPCTVVRAGTLDRVIRVNRETGRGVREGLRAGSNAQMCVCRATLGQRVSWEVGLIEGNVVQCVYCIRMVHGCQHGFITDSSGRSRGRHLHEAEVAEPCAASQCFHFHDGWRGTHAGCPPCS